jgi:hypothetical protein
MPTDDLDSLLHEAARTRPLPSPALLARVEADALTLQPGPVPPRRTPGVWARLSLAFGGGPALVGVCSAAVLGVALGYANPVTLDYVTGGLAGGLLGDASIDLFPVTDFLMEG